MFLGLMWYWWVLIIVVFVLLMIVTKGKLLEAVFDAFD